MCQGYIGKRNKGYGIGEPCDHKGCLSHRSHPCEGCGRILGVPLPIPWREYVTSLQAAHDDLVEVIKTSNKTNMERIGNWETELTDKNQQLSEHQDHIQQLEKKLEPYRRISLWLRKHLDTLFGEK